MKTNKKLKSAKAFTEPDAAAGLTKQPAPGRQKSFAPVIVRQYDIPGHGLISVIKQAADSGEFHYLLMNDDGVDLDEGRFHLLRYDRPSKADVLSACLTFSAKSDMAEVHLAPPPLPDIKIKCAFCPATWRAQLKSALARQKHCAECALWFKRVKLGRFTGLRMNGRHFTIGSPTGVRGCGGEMFSVTLLKTGETFTTTDLWHNGEIPRRFKKLLPDNARINSNDILTRPAAE